MQENSKKSNSKVAKNAVYLLVICAVSICAIHFLTSFQPARRICDFVIRTALITAKPYWDWSYVDRSGCLLMNPYFKPFTRPPDVNCYACQDLNRIQKYDNLGDSQLEYHLISQIPLMVSEHQETLKDLSQWKAFKYDRDDILEEYSRLEGRDVCEITASLRCEEPRSIFKWTNNDSFWFIHWENCSNKGKKFARQFYGRLNVIPSYVDLSLPSWVLLSKNYSAIQFKHLTIERQPNLAVFVQILGENVVELRPINKCWSLGCKSQNITVNSREALIFNPDLWTVYYKPSLGPLNYAVVLTGLHEPLI